MPSLSLANIAIAFVLLSVVQTEQVFATQVFSIEGNDVPVLTTGNSPTTDISIQRMAFDMAHADCDKLLALPAETKRIFLLSALFLQREGSLRKIVGPDCAFLGDTKKIAAIDDESLTIGESREVLYLLPDYNVLLVSHEEENTIAYGLFMDEDTKDEPLQYFLRNRSSAEQSAALARTFHETVGTIEPPIYEPTSSARTTVLTQQTSSQQAVAPGQTRSVQVNPPTQPQSRSGTTTSTRSNTTSASTYSLYQEPSDTPPKPDATTPSSAEIQYVGNPTDTLPSVQPIGPQPQPENIRDGGNTGYWIMMILFAFVLVGVSIVVIKTRVSKKQGYIDT